MNNMTTLKFRTCLNLVIGLISFFLGWIFIESIIILILGILPITFLIFLIPSWIIVIYLERELLWVLILFLKREPYGNLSVNYGKHERILDDYLKKSQEIDGEKIHK